MRGLLLLHLISMLPERFRKRLRARLELCTGASVSARLLAASPSVRYNDVRALLLCSRTIVSVPASRSSDVLVPMLCVMLRGRLRLPLLVRLCVPERLLVRLGRLLREFDPLPAHRPTLPPPLLLRDSPLRHVLTGRDLGASVESLVALPLDTLDPPFDTPPPPLLLQFEMPPLVAVSPLAPPPLVECWPYGMSWWREVPWSCSM